MVKLSRYLILGILSMAINGCSGTSGTESTGEYLDNTVVTSKIKAELINNFGAKAFQINVKTYKDEVQLSGFVHSERVKERAGVLAASVPQVKRVRNDLVVK